MRLLYSVSDMVPSLLLLLILLPLLRLILFCLAASIPTLLIAPASAPGSITRPIISGRRLPAPTKLVTPPQAVCVSCASSSTTACCSPRRRDTCITSWQQSRLFTQIEKNKIESPRLQTRFVSLDEPRYSFTSSMIVVCALCRGPFKLDP